jgi:phage FluMu protein Com
MMVKGMEVPIFRFVCPACKHVEWITIWEILESGHPYCPRCQAVEGDDYQEMRHTRAWKIGWKPGTNQGE